jgi:hypothetical protein
VTACHHATLGDALMVAVVAAFVLALVYLATR